MENRDFNIEEIEEVTATLEDVDIVVDEFKKELEAITDVRIKSVVQDIVIDIMTKSKISKKHIDYTKKVVAISKSLCESRGYTNLAKDVITASALLHDLYLKKHRDLHPLMIRMNHQEELRRLDPSIAENICSIIEAHHGYESIIPKIASKEGTIEQILTDAVTLALAL